MASQGSDQGQGPSKEAAQRGGEASGGNFKNDPERAAEAGQKGGERSQGGSSKDR